MNGHRRVYRYIAHITLATVSGVSVPVFSAEKDIYSLSLEELSKLEVTQRQPYRGDVPLEGLPQTMEVVTDQLMKETGVVKFQDALEFSNDVVQQNRFGNTWDSFAIRGFAGDENLPGGYFINGFSAGRGFSGLRDLVNIQSIEILKGAGAALYGHGEPGGTINIITKKPKFEPEGYLQISGAEFNTERLEADYTTAVNSRLAVRINGAYETGDSFRETVSSKKISFNPSLLVRLSEQSHITYELEILNQELPFDRGLVVLNNQFDQVHSDRFYGEPDDGPMKISATGHQLTFDEHFSQWSLLAGIGYRNSSLAGFSTEPELAANRQQVFSDGLTLNRQRRYRRFDSTYLSAKVELSGELQIGNLSNHILVGADNDHNRLTQIQNIWRVTPGDTTYAVNLQTPVYGQAAPALTPFWDLQEQELTTGVYVQDQIDLSQGWKLLAGVRYERLKRDHENFLDKSTSFQKHFKSNPRIGLIYQLSKSISFYTNYAEGFRPNSGTNWEGKPFEPENSRSYEIGTHFNLFDNKLTGALTFFRAEKSNILAVDPVHFNYSLAMGKAVSQGVEMNLDLALGDSTKLSLAYAYVDAYTANNMTNPDWGIEIPAGSRLLNIPQHKTNLILRKDLSLLSHAGNLGIAIVHVGERLGDVTDSNYLLPSYSTLRLFSGIDVTDKLQANFVAENLFNRAYFSNSYSSLWTQPGSPRNLQLSFRYLL